MARTFPCSQCGGEVSFDPSSGAHRCPWCGSTTAIPRPEAEIQELDYESWLQRQNELQESEERQTARCDSCGAESTLETNVTASACPFCGTSLVVQATSTRLIRPAALLPFAVDRERARKAFRTWLSGLWFAPNALKRLARQIGRLAGVYLPFWTFDCSTKSAYRGERGDDYTVSEPRWVIEGGRRVHRNRQVTHTRWTPASGAVSNTFDDVLIAATSSLPASDLAHLEPWDLDALVPYADDYLAGFRAEAYGVPLADGFRRATAIMESYIRADVARHIGGDRQRIHSVSTSYDAVTFKHLLLPVWISAYRYRDKVYRFLVNARTGEVRGDRPYSWIKITLAILAGLAVIVLLAWLDS